MERIFTVTIHAYRHGDIIYWRQKKVTLRHLRETRKRFEREAKKLIIDTPQAAEVRVTVDGHTSSSWKWYKDGVVCRKKSGQTIYLNKDKDATPCTT